MTSNIRYSAYRQIQQRPMLDQFARTLVFKLFKRLSKGHLIIEELGETHHFGQNQADAEIVARIFIDQEWVYRKLAFDGSLGAGESYMLGGWRSDNLLSVIQLICMNHDLLISMDSSWNNVGAVFSKILHSFNQNTLAGSRRNISAHYDLSNDFFALFLDPTMMYSCGIFPTEASTMEEASVYKLKHICERLNLQPTDHLVEIGTGWGGMAIYAAKHYGCKVTTTTISQEQYDYALAAVQAEGLEGKIELLLKDYRELEGTYDKLVSIEMIEAVGHKYYAEYFSRCSQLLKPNGLLLIQSITIADQRYQSAKKAVDFIQRYIFPGGALPSVEVISENVSKYTDLQIVGLEDITPHYARTLAAWREQFFERIVCVRKLGFDDVFERMWEFYLCYCEAGFRERLISTIQFVAAKPSRKALPLVE